MVVSPNMDDNLDDDLDDEDFENDEDLQNELSKLIETEGVSLPAGPSPAPPRPLPPPIPPRRDLPLDKPSLTNETKPPVPTTDLKVGHSAASTSSLQQMDVLPKNNGGTNKPAELPVDKSAHTSQQVSSSTAAYAEEAPSEKFKKILIKRRVCVINGSKRASLKKK
jgi:hypothetical protein